MISCKRENDTSTRKEKEDTNFFQTAPETVPELTSNRLTNEPSDFLRNQSTSSIHWQPWTPQVLDLAERSQRLILVFVGSTSYSQSYTVAKLLDEKFGPEINEEYVPVMADSELDPTLALACHWLSLERNESIAFPYLIWLSHEGHPVAWLPVTSDDEEDVLLGFRRAQNTVRAIRDKSPRYVVENSRYDNEGRVSRINNSMALPEEELIQPDRNQLFLSAQALTDLYDHVDRTFDQTGGIPPGNLITSLARMSKHPAAPRRFKESATQSTRESIELLVSSAIRDPLDGYFFTRRNSRSFAIPALSKNLKTQAEMLSAMASSPRASASAQATQQLLTNLSEKPLITTSLLQGETNELAFFWSLDSLEKILSEDEMTVAKAAFKLRGLGNIPSADDPRRDHFRRNTLGLHLSGSELANKVGKSNSEIEQLFQSLIKKIEARRTEILEAGDSVLTETMPVLTSKARLLTALARTQASDPKNSTLNAANKLGEEILAEFREEDGHLLRTPTQENSRKVSAFANDYVLTIEALLEWYRVTWSPEILANVQQLTSILLDEFTTEDDFLVEVPVDDYPLTFPIFSRSMVFGAATWGTSLGVLKRMKSLGFEHPKLANTISKTTHLVDLGLEHAPVVHTDYILAALNNLDGYVLVVSENQKNNQQLKNALAKPQFDSVCSVIEKNSFKNLPSTGQNAAILLKEGKTIATYSTAEEITSSLRATLAK